MPMRSERNRETAAFAAAPASRARRAILLGLRPAGRARAALHASLAELQLLAREVKIEVVCTVLQTARGASEGAVMGAGKLQELAALVDGDDPGQAGPPSLGFDTLLVNAPLTAHQHQALATAVRAEVIDRTELILRLFAARARTPVAKLSVEIARLRHALPRLREDQSKAGREGGGGRGERGHTQVTLAKQRTRARIAQLERELARARQAQAVQRARRHDLRRVAIVGYTNAGKSSWLAALTGSAVFVADKPFATLDTTVRALRPPEEGGGARREPILIADTVGFIRDLPHELIPSFHATLQEACEADLLVCVADAADPHVREQLEVTEHSLAAVGAGDVPRLLLLNKSDRADPQTRQRRSSELPDAHLVSALNAHDVASVRRVIAAHFAGKRAVALS